MRLGLRRFGVGSGRDVCEVECKDMLVTVDGHGLFNIWDVGIVDLEKVRQLEREAKVVEEHPAGDGEFLVMTLGDLCRVLGRDEPWFADSYVVVWVTHVVNDEFRLVVTDLLFE